MRGSGGRVTANGSLVCKVQAAWHTAVAGHHRLCLLVRVARTHETEHEWYAAACATHTVRKPKHGGVRSSGFKLWHLRLAAVCACYPMTSLVAYEPCAFKLSVSLVVMTFLFVCVCYTLRASLATLTYCTSSTFNAVRLCAPSLPLHLGGHSDEHAAQAD